MELVYNVYFELSAGFFILFLLLFVRTRYDLTLERNKFFYHMICCLLAVDVLDVVTACTISYGAIVPKGLNVLVNTIYFALNGLLGYLYTNYCQQYNNIYRRNRFIYMLSQVLLFGYWVLLLINTFTGLLFYFDQNGNYCHGILYLSVYIMPYIFFLMSACFMFMAFPQFNINQRVCIIMFLIVSASGGVLQLVWFSDVLLNVFTISLGITIVLFSLETPEYHQLKKTMVELEDAKEKAQKENASKSQFLANMSHEIRTPINAILGMNEMILRESEENTIREYAQNIQSASDILLSIVNEILDFSKVASGKMELVPVEYDVAALIRDCSTIVETRAAGKDLRLEVSCDETTPSRLYGDETRIRQILSNLLTNAVKYTPSGTITFRIRWAGNKEGVNLIASVEDTGIGISEENQKRLFDTFERFDLEKNHNIEGTGLGLSITKQLVDLMQGEIGVYSELGKGSLFYVEIPQKVVSMKPIGKLDEASHIEQNKVEKEKYHAPEARILVVDDVRMNVKVIQSLLKRTQIQVGTATSGEECLALAKKNAYDLILLDHMMPEMDGVETFQRLRADASGLNYKTPVIALTANAIEGAKEEYKALGFDDYLSKPMKGEELEDMIRRYLPEDKIVNE